MAMDKLKVECLVLVQSFETLWAYFLQSDGQLFSKECREESLRFLEVFDELSEQDSKFRDPVALGIGERTDIEDVVRRVRAWAQAGKDYPYDTASQSRFMAFALLAGLKSLLISDLRLSRWPTSMLSSEELDHSESVIRWKGHLPQAVLRDNPGELVKAASSSQSIVVVADMRRSQDLMTYANSAEDFSTRIVEFITTAREALGRHNGFFDKFTGDGYLVYFNEAVCNAADADYVECFLDFMQEHQAFAAEHFRNWTRNVRKLPGDEVGLAMGADLGTVRFVDLEHHLVAVGESIVWASRMASAASANEVIVNNLLFAALEEKPGLKFSPREARTKSGESFLGRSMRFVEGP